MKPSHPFRNVSFKDLPRGAAFRFSTEDAEEMTIGLKAFRGSEEVALLLSGAKVGKFLSSNEMSGVSVVELPDTSLVPSETEGVTPGAGNSASPTEIELRGPNLFFVAMNHMRVNLETGETSTADGARPAEIYSRWSLIRVDGDRRTTLYEHTPSPFAAYY